MYSRQTLCQQSCSSCSMRTYSACTYTYLCILEHSLIGTATVYMWKYCETRDRWHCAICHLNEISKAYKVFISWIKVFMPYMATGPTAGMSYILKVKTCFSNGRLECCWVYRVCGPWWRWLFITRLRLSKAFVGENIGHISQNVISMSMHFMHVDMFECVAVQEHRCTGQKWMLAVLLDHFPL